MECASAALGRVEYGQEATVHFPEGLPGFPEAKSFVVVQREEDRPFLYLQSIEHQALCFVTLPLDLTCPDYEFELIPEDLAVLAISEAEIREQVIGLSILTLLENGEVTANLLAPVLIHRQRRVGVQAVRADGLYSHAERLQLRGADDVDH
jgi:flagellar assembly factor FliW